MRSLGTQKVIIRIFRAPEGQPPFYQAKSLILQITNRFSIISLRIAILYVKPTTSSRNEN
jgi:hypothetical protein